MGSGQQEEIDYFAADPDVDSLILENRNLRLNNSKLNKNLGRRAAFVLNISKQLNKIRNRLKSWSRT